MAAAAGRISLMLGAGATPAVLHKPAALCGRPQLQRRRLAPLAAAGPGWASFSSSGPGFTSFTRTTSSSTGTAKPSVRANDSAGGAAPGGAAPEPAPAKKASKPRLPGLDSLRFFLIAYIAVGHFIAFATRDAFVLKLFTQVNVWVGAFFVLSGYVVGYTATELGRYEASPRVADSGAYSVARVAGYYPLFILVHLVFGAMFAWADATYNGPIAALAHGFMSVTLSQAWFPAHAEVWNAPTWFLSALTFAILVLPHVLPAISKLRKAGLRKMLLLLTGVSLLAKLGYSYDLNAWTLLEGMTTARSHPNLLVWNITRFNPFYCLLEVLMGVAACRLVMLDGVDDEGKPTGEAPAPAGSVLLPALGLMAITVARAAGLLPLNDPLTRALLFVPLFILLLMRLHRSTLAGSPGLTGVLAHPVLTYLGTISFPIFIVHGALGQVFYKKIVATKLWGGVMPPSFFPAYCTIVLLSAAAAQKFFLENKKVQEVSNNITKAITKLV